MDQLLLTALLAMDVYHRQQAGAGGIELTKELSSSDQASVLPDGARIIASSDLALARDIGFSAIAYDLGGQTFVVYRGTDDNGAAKENLLDWAVGGGTLDGMNRADR